MLKHLVFIGFSLSLASAADINDELENLRQENTKLKQQRRYYRVKKNYYKQQCRQQEYRASHYKSKFKKLKKQYLPSEYRPEITAEHEKIIHDLNNLMTEIIPDSPAQRHYVSQSLFAQAENTETSVPIIPQNPSWDSDHWTRNKEGH